MRDKHSTHSAIQSGLFFSHSISIATVRGLVVEILYTIYSAQHAVAVRPFQQSLLHSEIILNLSLEQLVGWWCKSAIRSIVHGIPDVLHLPLPWSIRPFQQSLLHKWIFFHDIGSVIVTVGSLAVKIPYKTFFFLCRACCTILVLSHRECWS